MTDSESPADGRQLPRLLRPLQRRTSGGSFLPVIDGLRFYAIGAVVLWHVYYNLQTAELMPDVPGADTWIPELMRMGKFGVELFFGISGFILALPFARRELAEGKRVKLGKYFKRRLTRLEPPYLLSLAFAFALRAWVLGVSGLWPHLLASSLYLHNVIYRAPSAVSAVTWSLEVEVQFYILAPLIALPFRIGSAVLRRAVWVGAMAVVALLRPHTEVEGMAWILPYLDYFLAGFLLADIFTDSWKSGERLVRSWSWDLAATACWGVIGLWLATELRVGAALLPATVFCLYYSIFRSRAWFALTTNPWIFTIGGMCYTLYLYHNILLRALVEKTPLVPWATETFGPTLGLAVVLPVLLAGVLAPCIVLFVLVERPCMRPDWPARLGRWLRRRLGGEPAEEGS